MHFMFVTLSDEPPVLAPLLEMYIMHTVFVLCVYSDVVRCT